VSRVSPDLPASLSRLLHGGRSQKTSDAEQADGSFAMAMNSRASAQSSTRSAAKTAQSSKSAQPSKPEQSSKPAQSSRPAAPQDRRGAAQDAKPADAPAKSDAAADSQPSADKTANRTGEKAKNETRAVCPTASGSDGAAPETRVVCPAETQTDAALLPAVAPVNPVAPPPPAPATAETTAIDAAAATPVAAAGEPPAPATTPLPQSGDDAAGPCRTENPKGKPKVAITQPVRDTPAEGDAPEAADGQPAQSDASAKPAATAAPHAQAASNASDDKPDKPETAAKESARDGAERALPPEPQTQATHRGHTEPAHFMAQTFAANHATAASQAQATSATTSAAQSVPMHAIALEIAGQARAGNSRFEIRLDPPELGRIDVRLDVDRDGNVSSRLVIDRAETYDLLRRDQSTLERALQQAGLKTSDQSLQFSLRDQNLPQRQHDEASPRMTAALVQDGEVLPGEAASGYARVIGRSSGVDIRV
jgi:chemotaxis protein MotD